MKATGVIYEVNIEVDAAIGDDYLRWLDTHMRELVALPGFTGAQRWRVTDPLPPAGRLALCVQYTLIDAAALDAYLRDHAPRLRADGIARFGTRFSASRRVLRPIG